MTLYRHDSLLFSNHFFHCLNDNGDLYYLLGYLLDILIYSDYLGNHSLDLYEFWNFNQFLSNSFDLIYLRDSDSLFYNFFNDLLSSYYLLNFCLNGNKLFYDSWHFLDNLLEIRYYLFDFNDRLFYQDTLNYPLYLSDFNNFVNYLHDLLHYLRNWNDPFNDLFSWNDLLYDSINWNWNLKRHDNLLLNWDWQGYFHILSYNLLNSYRSWDLLNNVNWNLS